MPGAKTSYPKNKIKILLLENISPAAVEELRAYGYADVRQLNGALSEAELARAMTDVHLLGIRSKTQITKRVIDAADKLLAIGCFCIGVNQVHLAAATKKGVAVFNAPHANTRSVAELIIGLCVMLIRKIPDKNAAARQLIETILGGATWWNVFGHYAHDTVFEARLPSGHRESASGGRAGSRYSVSDF